MSESDVFTPKYYLSLPYLYFNVTYASRHFRTSKLLLKLLSTQYSKGTSLTLYRWQFECFVIM